MTAPTASSTVYAAALLQAIEESGVAVLTLTEGLLDEELLCSRLTRHEVERQLRLFSEASGALPSETRTAMPEIDWSGIEGAGQALAGPAGRALDDALVFGSRSLAPATLMWLRVYRQQHPAWFVMRPD